METQYVLATATAGMSAFLAYFFGRARAREDRLVEAYADWVGAVLPFLAACEDEWAAWYEANSPGSAIRGKRALLVARKERRRYDSKLAVARARLMLLEADKASRDKVAKISFFCVPDGTGKAMNDYMDRLVRQMGQVDKFLDDLRERRATPGFEIG